MMKHVSYICYSPQYRQYHPGYYDNFGVLDWRIDDDDGYGEDVNLVAFCDESQDMTPSQAQQALEEYFKYQAHGTTFTPFPLFCGYTVPSWTQYEVAWTTPGSLPHLTGNVKEAPIADIMLWGQFQTVGDQRLPRVVHGAPTIWLRNKPDGWDDMVESKHRFYKALKEYYNNDRELTLFTDNNGRPGFDLSSDASSPTDFAYNINFNFDSFDRLANDLQQFLFMPVNGGWEPFIPLIRRCDRSIGSGSLPVSNPATQPTSSDARNDTVSNSYSGSEPADTVQSPSDQVPSATQPQPSSGVVSSATGPRIVMSGIKNGDYWDIYPYGQKFSSAPVLFQLPDIGSVVPIDFFDNTRYGNSLVKPSDANYLYIANIEEVNNPEPGNASKSKQWVRIRVTLAYLKI